MTRATITHQLELPANGVPRDVYAELACIASNDGTLTVAAFASGDDGSVVGIERAYPNSQGVITFTGVRPNSGVSSDVIDVPLNTRYRFTLKWPLLDDVVLWLNVPDSEGPHSTLSILDFAPTDLDTPEVASVHATAEAAEVAAAAAAGGLAAHIAASPAHAADEVSFDGTAVGLIATNVQAGIVEAAIASYLAITALENGTVKITPAGELEVPNEGDIYLAAGGVVAGSITEGVLRRSNGLRVAPLDYTQVVAPVDDFVGRWVAIDWLATLRDTGGMAGPTTGKGWFGPPGAFDLSGLVQWGADSTELSLGPISYADLLVVRNEGITSRRYNTGWGFMRSQWLWSKEGTMTLLRNDTLPGGASFLDNPLWLTSDDGAIDGLTNNVGHFGFASKPFFIGNTSIRHRTAFYSADFNSLTREWGADPDIDNPGIGGGADDGDGGTTDTLNTEVDWNIGFHAGRMTRGNKNIGILNDSATVERPWAVTLSDTGDALPLDTSVLEIDNDSGGPLAITSTPTIPDGVNGQRISILSVASDPITLFSDASLPGTSLKLGSPTRVLAQGSLLTLRWSDTLDTWVEESVPGGVETPAYLLSLPSVISGGSATGNPPPWATAATSIDGGDASSALYSCSISGGPAS